MKFDYAKLNGRIREKCQTQARFAAKMGLSERSVSFKLNGHRYWTQGDINTACEVLDIKPSELAEYFFTPQVRYIEQESGGLR